MALISFAVCAFVFSKAKIWFSHNAAHLKAHEECIFIFGKKSLFIANCKGIMTVFETLSTLVVDELGLFTQYAKVTKLLLHWISVILITL